MKSYPFKIVAVLALACWFGCTFTQSYQPGFNSKKAAVLDSIKGKYGFEDVKFQAKKVSKDGETHASLTVKFINGKSIPADTAQITAIEKILGSQIKSIIKNQKEFDSYIILLDKMTVKGDVTNETYTGYEFKSNQL